MNEPTLDRLAGEPRLTVGQRLVNGRKARGWTVEYVSSQLHLPESTVQALETDDYRQLPAEVYVKGYLRNYARLLHLPPEDLVHSYYEQQVSAPSSPDFVRSPRPAARPRRPAPPDSRSSMVRSARPEAAKTPPEPRSTTPPWLTLALIAAMFAIWWWPDQGISVSDWASRIGSVWDAVLSAPADLAAGIEATLPQVATDAENTPDPGAVTPEEPVQPVQPAQPTLPEKPHPEEAPAKPDTAAPDTPKQVESDTLVLRFDGDSWATVMDADGHRLIHQTGVAGTSKVLKGKAPFHLTIGRVSNVSMEFNGQPIVFPNQKNRATERFSLPLQSAQ